MKLLSLNVFRWDLGDCSANGVSSRTKEIYIPCEEGPTNSEDIDPELIFIPEQRGPNYWALKPMTPGPSNAVGPMSGGNLAYSCDSRCKHVYHIHDRYESQACYNSNF